MMFNLISFKNGEEVFYKEGKEVFKGKYVSLLENANADKITFGINVETNYYNCFGCSATGNIFSLVQNVEGLNFVEAIQRLSIYSGLSTESTELDMKQTLREFNFSIEELLSRDLKTNLPGGISETQFLFSIAERLKSYEKWRQA